MNTQHFDYYFQEAPAEWLYVNEDGKAESALFYFNDSIQRWANDEGTEEDAEFDWRLCYVRFLINGIEFFLCCDISQSLSSVWGRCVEIMKLDECHENIFDYEFYDSWDHENQFSYYSNFLEMMDGPRPILFIDVIETD